MNIPPCFGFQIPGGYACHQVLGEEKCCLQNTKCDLFLRLVSVFHCVSAVIAITDWRTPCANGSSSPATNFSPRPTEHSASSSGLQPSEEMDRFIGRRGLLAPRPFGGVFQVLRRVSFRGESGEPIFRGTGRYQVEYRDPVWSRSAHQGAEIVRREIQGKSSRHYPFITRTVILKGCIFYILCSPYRQKEERAKGHLSYQ